jgi:CheY-like chemotaxis protein
MSEEHTVLLVEDDEFIREDLCALLQVQGYRVVCAANGEEALQCLHSGDRPCVILLDLMMPVMNGWDFRAAQLRDASLAGIPVLLLSGASDVAHHAATLQARDYVVKPFRLPELYEKVARHC